MLFPLLLSQWLQPEQQIGLCASFIHIGFVLYLHTSHGAPDYTDIDFLHKELVRLTEKTFYGLRADEKMTGCVTVKIRYSNFETFTCQETIDYTALDDVLIAKVKDLFTKNWQKARPVRLLGVRFSHMIPITMQMSLFENNVEKLNLFKAVDDIKDRFGKQSVMKAVNTEVKDGSGKTSTTSAGKKSIE